MRAGLAPLQGLHDAMRAINGAAVHAEWRASLASRGRPAPLAGVGPLEERTGRFRDEAQGKAALAAHGLRTPEGRVVGLSEVAAAARGLGGLVVVKGLHEKLAHKTEAGAMALGLETAQAAQDAARRMVGTVATRDPSIRLERFLVERMLPHPVLETLVGIQRDPQFGLTLTIGVGGVLVELIGEVTTLLLPAGRDDIVAALTRGALGRLMQGYRGRPAGDLEAAASAVEAIAGYAVAQGD
ncbi:hypothetical protein SLNSH_17300 [Alsobacter soli]|uniref:ATP-grasp domain-containing protein n=1 Tax=Alsobacter soli TaxID=2109933 RepID=A0A2T1HPZ1_9HYPH|nr:acetate--CoA ligase family protein [Alsobacter soli]PSC03703.1 hypothetical protein SLNSH_17300 [Alsobacter soli]